MKSNDNSNSMGEGLKPLPVRLGLVALALGAAVSLSTPANATTPAVGSQISNQASATYTDGSNAPKTATSNSVVTTVTQVAALSLVQDNTKSVSISGGTINMPHTLTNLGNGSDKFTLPLTDNHATGTFSSMQIYLDADGNGVPDSTTPLCTGAACSTFTTPSIPAGGTFKFVVALQVPPTSAGTFDTETVTATSVFDTSKTAANTDTVIVTAGPAFNITKAISVPSGAKSATACDNTNYAGGSCVKVRYTLTYTNTGAAGPLYIKDIIGSGATAGMQYIAGSARWGAAGTTPLEESATTETATGIVFQSLDSSSNAYVSNATTTGSSTGAATIEAVIANVPSGFSDTISFDVGVSSTALVGISSTTNTGLYDVGTGTSCVAGSFTVANCKTTNPANSTNPSPYTVGSTFGVISNDGTTSGTPATPSDVPDTTISGVNLVAVAEAAPGTTVVFNNYIWNTGSGDDTFDLVLSNPTTGAFPTGTTFQMFKSDGATALSDSNGGGIADTGQIAAGAAYEVVVKAFIPAGACTVVSCPSGPYTVNVTATSVGDSSKSNKVYDQLTVLKKPSVDLTNTATGTAGDATHGADQGAWVSGSTLPTTTLPATVAAPAVFDLYVKNAGTAPDNYNLEYSASDFLAGTTRAGWSVVLRSDGTANGTGTSCTATSGTVITNSGSVGIGSQYHYCAVVTPAANEVSATYPVYFRVISGATGASDVKLDAVTVTASPTMVITPNGSNQVYPGGSVIYPHDLKNTGNLSCGNGGTQTFTFTVSGVNTGWTVAVYEDTNANGAIDATDVLLVSHNGTAMAAGTNMTGPLSVNDVRKLLAKVTAPAGAAQGDTDNILINVVDNSTVACTSPTANDATLVVTGQLRLDKYQVLDAKCAGTATAFANITAVDANKVPLQAAPGDCLVYLVKAANAGTTNVTNVTINDNTPSYTVYQGPFNCTAGTATPATPTVGSPASLSCAGIATMIPGQVETMKFVVKVNP